MSNIALAKIAAQIDALPMLPQVLVRILQLNSEQDDFFEQIDNLAQQDPPLAVKILAIANSAASSPVSPIKSIKEALTRVGATSISNLVASLAVQRVFVPSSRSQMELWHHSIRAAVAAQIIAGMLPELKIEKGQAYLAGLLHDIGRFVMFEHAPENLLKVDESNWHSPQELIKADVEIFTYTHCELGYLACIRWGLPDEIAMMVKRHHEKWDTSFKPGGIESNIICIGIADELSLIITNPTLDDLSSDELLETISQKCLWSSEIRKLLKPTDLAAQLDKIKTDSERLISGLGLA